MLLIFRSFPMSHMAHFPCLSKLDASYGVGIGQSTGLDRKISNIKHPHDHNSVIAICRLVNAVVAFVFVDKILLQMQETCSLHKT